MVRSKAGTYGELDSSPSLSKTEERGTGMHKGEIVLICARREVYFVLTVNLKDVSFTYLRLVGT